MIALVAVLALPLGPAAPQESRPAVDSAPLAARLAGAWRELGAENPRVIGFLGERCVQVYRGGQSVMTVAYGADAMERTPCDSGSTLREQVRIEGPVLTLTYPGGNAFRFERVDPTKDPETFDSVRLDAIPLGVRTPGAEELADLRSELEARVEREQEIRRRIAPLMQVPPEERGIDALNAVGEEMRAIDLDNTRYLTGLLQDVGWIDTERFGEDARHDAFLIVQHSPSLRLMGTVLPILEAEARDDPSTGGPYAYLHDRYQLSMCGMQRYGTQLYSGPDGAHYVVRLEDPEGVDERREAFALGPLEDYLDLFRSGGTPVVVGDLPERSAGGD